MMTNVEGTGLVTCDIEVLRLHYAETLKHWRARFAANRDKAKEIYDERFCRMWEFYLVCSELSFRHGVHNVFQLQLGKRQESVPLTRDYLYQPDPIPVSKRTKSCLNEERRHQNVR